MRLDHPVSGKGITLTGTQEVLVYDIQGRFGFNVIEDGGGPNFSEYCGDFQGEEVN
jgi:hypothetical protein